MEKLQENEIIEEKSSFMGISSIEEPCFMVKKALEASAMRLDIFEFIKVTGFKINPVMVSHLWQTMVKNARVHVHATLFELFGYEGAPKEQRRNFLQFAKRQNIKPLELTYKSSEIEDFPEIKQEIENEQNKGVVANKKWIIMNGRDIKTVMMKLGTKNGDMIRSYYVDLEELMALYAEYTMFFNLREAKTHKDQAVAKLNQKMDEMRLSMESKHEQALQMLCKMGVTLEDVKEQNKELLDQNDELINQNDQTNEKLDETVENLEVVMDKLNIAVEDRAPRLKRHGIRERFVLLKKNDNPNQRFQYYAIRGQANYVNARLTKLQAERFPNLIILVDILCQPNPRNLFLRFKERVDGLEEWNNNFIYAGNDVGCPIEMEIKMINIFMTLDDEKRDV
jgi:hypothetical protein